MVNKNIPKLSIHKSDLKVQLLSFKVIVFLEQIIELISESLQNKQGPHSDQISFIWSFEAKEVGIFLKSSVLQLLKLEQFAKDEQKSEEEVNKYCDELFELIQKVDQSLLESYEKISSGSIPKKEDWIHQNNPGYLINTQIKELIDQIKTIQRSQHKLDQISGTLHDFRTSYEDHMKERAKRAAAVLAILEELEKFMAHFGDQCTRADLVKIISKIQSEIVVIEKYPGLSPYQFIVLEDTNKLKLPVTSKGGVLMYKSIDILSEISGWTTFHMLSPLKTIDLKLKNFEEKILITIFHLLNRIKAKIENSSVEKTYSNIENLVPIQRLIKEYHEELFPDHIDKLTNLKTKLNKYIIPSQLFNLETNFLPSSSISQLSNIAEKAELGRRYNTQSIRSILASIQSSLFSKYSSENQLTAAGYINSILDFNVENDANVLFLKNGFLGSSFTVDRPEIMSKVDKHFQLWRKGYGGALLIKGSHLSGRSTILEMLPIVYSNIPSHHIFQGQKLDINGRKKSISNDLIETLDFIVKYKGSEKCMVTIDDLDFFSSSAGGTFDLFSKITMIIQKYSKQIYFAVTMHNYLAHKLKDYFNFETIFSETISTDFMQTNLIKKAVLIRAQAVFNHEEAQYNVDIMSAMARKVSKQAHNNIGKAMQLWCIHKGVLFNGDEGNEQFKNLVLKNESLLITLIANGTIYEPEYRSMYNDLDAWKIKSEIDMLVKIRMLIRPEEGFVSINPYLYIFIESILKKV